MKDTWLRCTVIPGQFSSEYAVTAHQANNAEFSLFAPLEYIDCAGDPTLQEPTDAWLRVEVWGQQGEMYLIRLPQPSFESGHFVTVNGDQLKSHEPCGQVAE